MLVSRHEQVRAWAEAVWVQAEIVCALVRQHDLGHEYGEMSVKIDASGQGLVI